MAPRLTRGRAHEPHRTPGAGDRDELRRDRNRNRARPDAPVQHDRVVDGRARSLWRGDSRNRGARTPRSAAARHRGRCRRGRRAIDRPRRDRRHERSRARRRAHGRHRCREGTRRLAGKAALRRQPPRRAHRRRPPHRRRRRISDSGAARQRGHTSLLLVRDLVSDVELLGETMDDAAGEAFDKIARILGLPYPGGPEIDRAAASGDPRAIRFPRGMSRASDMAEHRYDFSFSGLKTAVARWCEQREAAGESVPIADVAASFREAVVDVLVTKALDACARHDVPRLLLGGGVIANRRLRDVALERGAAAGVAVRIPPLSLCTDNGAMIAGLAAELIASGREPSTLEFGADSTLPVTEIQVIR